MVEDVETLNFQLDEHHHMLAEAVERLVREQYAKNRTPTAVDPGWQRKFWETLAAQGILGAILPDESGGLGLGALGAMQIMQMFGRGLVISPYLPSVICAAALISRCGSAAQKAGVLADITQGTRIVAFALDDAGHRGIPSGRYATATRVGDVFRISGVKTFVVGATWADDIMVIARVSNQPQSLEGPLAAFLVPARARGLSANPARTIDGSTASELTFDNVEMGADSMVGPSDGIGEEIERIADEATVALCAEASGAIGALLDATVEYSKLRRQFGQPISGFQVLQHRMVDMLVARDQAASIVHHASICLTADRRTRQSAASACKAKVGRLGLSVAQASVQIHGGVGTTDELDVSRYFRRLEVINLQFGNPEDHVRRYAQLQER